MEKKIFKKQLMKNVNNNFFLTIYHLNNYLKYKTNKTWLQKKNDNNQKSSTIKTYLNKKSF